MHLLEIINVTVIWLELKEVDSFITSFYYYIIIEIKIARMISYLIGPRTKLKCIALFSQSLSSCPVYPSCHIVCYVVYIYGQDDG